MKSPIFHRDSDSPSPSRSEDERDIEYSALVWGIAANLYRVVSGRPSKVCSESQHTLWIETISARLIAIPTNGYLFIFKIDIHQIEYPIPNSHYEIYGEKIFTSAIKFIDILFKQY